LDNYSTGTVNNHVDNVIYIHGETCDIEKHVDFKPDYIYHLGEYSRVEQSFNDMEKVWRYNKDGIFAVLQFTRKTGAKLIYAGSSTKFGDGGLGRSQSPYAWTKASNTELVENYGCWFGISFAIVYFYNVYGKREISEGKYATLIAIFKEQLKKQKKLTVVSPGEQIRNFTHVYDIIRGLILVGENGCGDEFGIGCDESFTILQIAQMFGGEIDMLPERRGNRMVADVVTDKTRALGWETTKSVKNYIKEFKSTL
jgi:UDP-glucose 4-epimerase